MHRSSRWHGCGCGRAVQTRHRRSSSRWWVRRIRRPPAPRLALKARSRLASADLAGALQAARAAIGRLPAAAAGRIVGGDPSRDGGSVVRGGGSHAGAAPREQRTRRRGRRAAAAACAATAGRAGARVARVQRRRSGSRRARRDARQETRRTAAGRALPAASIGRRVAGRQAVRRARRVCLSTGRGGSNAAAGAVRGLPRPLASRGIRSRGNRRRPVGGLCAARRGGRGRRGERRAHLRGGGEAVGRPIARAGGGAVERAVRLCRWHAAAAGGGRADSLRR